MYVCSWLSLYNQVIERKAIYFAHLSRLHNILLKCMVWFCKSNSQILKFKGPEKHGSIFATHLVKKPLWPELFGSRSPLEFMSLFIVFTHCSESITVFHCSGNYKAMPQTSDGLDQMKYMTYAMCYHSKIPQNYILQKYLASKLSESQNVSCQIADLC